MLMTLSTMYEAYPTATSTRFSTALFPHVQFAAIIFILAFFVLAQLTGGSTLCRNSI